MYNSILMTVTKIVIQQHLRQHHLIIYSTYYNTRPHSFKKRDIFFYIYFNHVYIFQ